MANSKFPKNAKIRIGKTGKQDFWTPCPIQPTISSLSQWHRYFFQPDGIAGGLRMVCLQKSEANAFLFNKHDEYGSDV